jgi:hypothetical protein
LSADARVQFLTGFGGVVARLRWRVPRELLLSE